MCLWYCVAVVRLSGEITVEDNSPVGVGYFCFTAAPQDSCRRSTELHQFAAPCAAPCAAFRSTYRHCMTQTHIVEQDTIWVDKERKNSLVDDRSGVATPGVNDRSGADRSGARAPRPQRRYPRPIASDARNTHVSDDWHSVKTPLPHFSTAAYWSSARAPSPQRRYPRDLTTTLPPSTEYGPRVIMCDEPTGTAADYHFRISGTGLTASAG